MDKDIITQDKMIGTVTIDILPLISMRSEATHTEKAGIWYPIYHFERGLRGDLLVGVSILYSRDDNNAKEILPSDVQFFCKILPPPAQVKKVIKMVEELLVIDFKRKTDDKVHDTISLIESKCLKLQRKLAKQVSRDCEANAIIGYR